jgi:hypothetical protein
MFNSDENCIITYEEFKLFCDKFVLIFDKFWREEKFKVESLSDLDSIKEVSYFVVSPMGEINGKSFNIDKFVFYTLDELNDFIKQNSKNMILMACHKLIVPSANVKFVIFCSIL